MKDYLASNAEMLISLIFPFCRQEFMLLLTIFCKEVNLHKGGKSDPKGILFLKLLHMTILYLCVFRQKWDLNLNAAQLPPSGRVTRQMDALMA